MKELVCVGNDKFTSDSILIDGIWAIVIGPFQFISVSFLVLVCSCRCKHNSHGKLFSSLKLNQKKWLLIKQILLPFFLFGPSSIYFPRLNSYVLYSNCSLVTKIV